MGDENESDPKPSNVERERVRAQVRLGLFDLGKPYELGRYEVRERIGAGATGIVYAGFDAELGRRVALKVLNSLASTGPRAAEQTERMRREAQALGKLSHPNVVTVFEVGTHGEQLFIAMELVDGRTLREWLDSEARAPREVIETMIAAGRGLAAAHEQGLVHRDFKPENVLVGNDGRVRVLDFGLARLMANGDAEGGMDGVEEAVAVAVEGSSGPPDEKQSTLTRTDVGLGTPLYMAPEQYAGGDVDARADQFAFCAVLYEALLGTSPFGGATLGELRENVEAGRLRPPGDGARVDQRVRALLIRGLSTRRDARFGSMNELLAELEKDPARTRNRVLSVVAIAAVAALGAVGVTRALANPTVCRGADKELAGVWDAETEKKVREAFDATELPYAADAFERVKTAIDAQAEAWVTMHTEACEATHVDGKQSPALLDLRMTCLDRRKQELHALTRVMVDELDPKNVSRVVNASRKLSSLDRCGNAEQLMAAAPPPEDPEVRRKVMALRERIERGRANRSASVKRALDETTAIVADAREIGYPPVLADALMQLAIRQRIEGDVEKAEETGYEAAQVAAAAHHDEVAAYAWVHLVYTVGFLQARYEDGLMLRPMAEAAVARFGDDPQMKARLHNNLGILYERRAEYDLAMKAYEECRRVTLEAFGPKHRNLIAINGNLGSVKRWLGRYREATEHHRLALALAKELYAEWESRSTGVLDDLGPALARQGELDEAKKYLEIGIAERSKTHGADHWETQMMQLDLGDVLRRQGDVEQARRKIEHALEIYEKAHGPDHPRVARALELWALALADASDHQTADDALRRALRIRKKTHRKDHPSMVTTHRIRGEVALGRGDGEAAAAHCTVASELAEKLLAPKHPELAYALLCLARTELRDKDAASAAAHLSKAVEIWRAEPVDPADMRRAELDLVRAKAAITD